MVFSLMDQDRDTYHLFRRFSYPGENGLRDAISVSSKTGNQLVAAYTFMLQLIFLQLWTIVVLVGVYFSVRRKHKADTAHITASVWTVRESTQEVLQLMAVKLWQLKQRAGKKIKGDAEAAETEHLHLGMRWWLPFVWLLVALVALVINYAVPIIVIPSLVIGNGAPVSSEHIYIPKLPAPGPQEERDQVRVANLEAPAALRAAGIVQIANSTSRGFVNVTQPTVIGQRANGENIVQIGYQYNVSARDLGLQHYDKLTLFVEGSCYTEYGWLVDSQTGLNGFTKDTYHPWNDADEEIEVGLSDSNTPLVNFKPGKLIRIPSSGFNYTFAAVISSVDRKSYTRGTDPWYLTNRTSAADGRFTVLPGRPALSCWQTDIWTHDFFHTNASVISIASLPDLQPPFPVLMSTIFTRFLVPPKIVTLATHLGASALSASSSTLGEFFDANSSTTHADLSRLLLASYISSANTLTDSTLYANDTRRDIPNLLVEPKQFADASDFVVYSSNISTLSMLVLILVPVLATGLWLVVIVLAFLNLPPREKINEAIEKATAKVLSQEGGGLKEEEGGDVKEVGRAKEG